MKPISISGIAKLAALLSTSSLLSCTYPDYSSPPPPVTYTYQPAPPVYVIQESKTDPTVQVNTETTAVEAPQSDSEASLEPLIGGLIKLAQSGASEEVLDAYILSQSVPRPPTAEEVVHLNDIGFSEKIVTTIIRASGRGLLTSPSPEDQALGEELVNSIPQGTTHPPAPVQEASLPPVQTQLPATPVTVVQQPVVVQQPQPVIVQEQPVVVQQFYTELQPYGSWVQVDNYGSCWQPTVVHIDSTWRPYQHRGRWLNTDLGWYWQSDYSWGHIPFHYGRWTRHQRHGWLWVPGDTWAPAWVSWRRSADYCGWAPLPPAARYRHGRGFHYEGHSIHAHLDFGLGYLDYTYVATRHLHASHVHRHALHRDRARNVHGNTTVINQHIVNNGNLVINNGVPVDQVELASRTSVPSVRVQSVPNDQRRAVRPDTIERHENGLVVRAVGAPARSNTSTAGSSSGRNGNGQGNGSRVAAESDRQTASAPRVVIPSAINRAPSTERKAVTSSTRATKVTKSSTPTTSRTAVPRSTPSQSISKSSNRTVVSSAPKSTPQSSRSRSTIITRSTPERSLADAKRNQSSSASSLSPLKKQSSGFQPLSSSRPSRVTVTPSRPVTTSRSSSISRGATSIRTPSVSTSRVTPSPTISRSRTYQAPSVSSSRVTSSRAPTVSRSYQPPTRSTPSYGTSMSRSTSSRYTAPSTRTVVTPRTSSSTYRTPSVSTPSRSMSRSSAPSRSVSTPQVRSTPTPQVRSAPSRTPSRSAPATRSAAPSSGRTPTSRPGSR